MSRYSVTVEAQRIVSLSYVVEVEAKNVAAAKAEVNLMIARDLIPDDRMEKIDSHIAGMSIADVEKIQ